MELELKHPCRNCQSRDYVSEQEMLHLWKDEKLIDVPCFICGDKGYELGSDAQPLIDFLKDHYGLNFKP